MADWQAIKTEYITTQTSYRKLAQKYGIHYKVISDRGKDEKWVELRSQHRDKTLTKTLDKISQQEANRAARIYSVADKLLNKIEAMADRPEPLTEKGLRALTASVKDLRDVLGVKSDLDKQEQKARIAHLQRQAEKDNDNSTGVVEVVFAAGPEEWNE